MNLLVVFLVLSVVLLGVYLSLAWVHAALSQKDGEDENEEPAVIKKAAKDSALVDDGAEELPTSAQAQPVEEQLAALQEQLAALQKRMAASKKSATKKSSSGKERELDSQQALFEHREDSYASSLVDGLESSPSI